MEITNRNIVFDKDIQKITQSNIDSIFTNNVDHEKILVIGDVQSGKTRQIIQSLKNAKNFGYKVTIILCGHTNYLLNQTDSRLKSDLKIEDGFESINFDTIHQDLIIKDLHIWISLLKSKKIEKQLQELLRIFKQHYTSSEGILIVDDECDSYSLLTNKNECENLRKISKCISNFYSEIVKIPNHKIKYLAVTATPFDNIRFFPNNKYDRSILLNHSGEYTGNEYFNNLNDFYITIPSYKEDTKSWNQIIKHAFISWISNTFCMLNDKENIIQINDIKEKKLFRCQEVEKINKLTKSQFVININVRTPTHDQVFNIFSDIFSSTNYDEIAMDNNFEKNKFSSFIKELKNKLLVYIVNNNKSKYRFTKNKFVLLSNENFVSGESDFQIIIGGNIISRGLTFDYLLTEIMLSAPHNKCQCDTLLQKARWFGYRQLTSKYMHVFTNENIKNKYELAQEDLDFIHLHGNDISQLIKYRGGEV